MASSALDRERLRILTVMARPLYPADTGGRIRSSQLFERLSRMHHVTIVCFRSSEDDAARLERMRACCSRLETVDWSETSKFTPRFYAELGAGLLSPLPYTVRKYRSAAMRQRIRRLLATGDYDLLLCDFLQPAVNCWNEPFRPKVLFEHNVEAVIRRRHADHEQRPLVRVFLRQEALKLHRFERRVARAMERCIMVSDEDCRVLAREYGVAHASAVPTGVDVNYFRPEGQEATEPEIAFVGSMDWLPNQDAVHWFVTDALPRIRAQVPATFRVIGRNPPKGIRDLACRHVHVTGTVDDIRPEMARAWVCVVPMRVGGGTRIKIFEAMAMGKPVVSTSVGAEGLPVSTGRDIVLADDAEEFAKVVVRLLTDRAAREALGQAGLRLVSEQYTWDAAAQRFSDICVEVVRQART